MEHDHFRKNRANSRREKIIKTVSSGLLAKIINIGVSLMIVPMSLSYLGKEQYGLWVTVSSFVGMLSFMDGGAGNAVLNMVAHASGSGSNQQELKKIVSTAFFGLTALAMMGCLLFFVVFPYVSWGKLLGVAGSTSLSELNVVVIVVVLFFFVSMVTTLVGKVQRGLQEGNLDNFWGGLASLLSLLFVYIVIKKDAGLVGFIIAFLAGPMLAYLMSNIHYLLILRRDLLPRIANVNKVIANDLFKVGGMFFVLQIAATIQGQADNVIIANMLGAGEVTGYAICMKLFLMPPMLFGLVMAPLWPAYREAIASNDMQWVKRVFLKSLRWALFISIPSACVLVLLAGKIIKLWVGQEVVPSIGLLVGCGIWMVFNVAGGALVMLFSGMQLIKIQVMSSVFTGVVNVILSIYLINMFGVVGAVFGNIIAWFLCTLIPYSIAAKKILSKQEGDVCV